MTEPVRIEVSPVRISVLNLTLQAQPSIVALTAAPAVKVSPIRSEPAQIQPLVDSTAVAVVFGGPPGQNGLSSGEPIDILDLTLIFDNRLV